MATLTVSSWSVFPPHAPCVAISLLPEAARTTPCWRVGSLRQRQRHQVCPIRRLDTCNSKCFATNMDVDCDNKAAEDSIAKNVRPIPSCCSAPVHLKSDILHTNSLELTSKVTDTDRLLIELPVLSTQEQEALAATPTHPAGLYVLYSISLVSNLVEQLWNLVWPAGVAIMHPSLLPVAVVGFFTKFAIFLGGPIIGKQMDLFPRLAAYHCLNSIQTVAQLLSAGMIIYALKTVKHGSTSSIILQPWFILLVVAGATERLAGVALGVAMERDWVVQLAGRTKPVALAQANSMLSRIDLFCEIAGASLFGILLSIYKPVTCLKIACALTICAQPVLFMLGQLINSISNGCLNRSKFRSVKLIGVSSLLDIWKIFESGLVTFKHGWKEYKCQPVLPASLAYVLLFFNIALAPGAIMTTFLVHHGISPSTIGGFSGSCSIMGFLATFLSSILVNNFGILKAGAAGLIFQACFLTFSVCVYWSGSITQRTRLLLFLSLIVVSQIGRMSYDIVGTQILQTGIPRTKANLIGVTEASMASLAEFFMLGVAIVANDVAHFGFLATLSVSSVVAAAAIFCMWLANPTEDQRELFNFDTTM